MNRAEALRELYEALDMLDASQAGRAGAFPAARAGAEPEPFTVDLRDADGGLLTRRLGRPDPRVTLAADWERGTPRW